VFLAALPAACTTAQEVPTRVILFVPDGAGAGIWTIGRLTIDDPAFEQLPVIGLVDTRGSEHTVSESAATATAYSTGVRTFEGGLAVGPDSTPLTTVLEVARDRGMATGLITTTLITDATPAAFCAHYTSRDHAEVARQMAEAGVTLLLGGGRGWFERVVDADSVSLLNRMKERYTYVDSAPAFHALDPDTVTALLGLFARGDVALAPQREPTLAEMTSFALEMLGRDDEGFFLLVENEETDTQTHRNEPFEVLAPEVQAFDDAIRIGLEYQRRHPETLIVVVGDHETGGLSIVTDRAGHPDARYTTTGHTAALLPVFAGGPGAEAFGAVLDNSRVGELLLEAVRR
jgi:alkaline phosphatase